MAEKAPTLKNLLAEDKKQFEKDFVKDSVKEEVKKEKVDLDKNREASAARVEELRNGRSLGDIPAGDEYWTAVNKHRLAHSKGFK